MKRVKKKRVIKKRRRKNPLHSFITDRFRNHIEEAILSGSPHELSKAFVLAKLNDDRCDDCDKEYDFCKCEGSREDNERACEDCRLNYCLCGYDIYFRPIEPRSVRTTKVRKLAWKLAKEKLDKSNLDLLYQRIINSVKEYKDLYQIDNGEELKDILK